MHMIRHATGPVTFATGIARDCGQVGVEFGTRLGIEQGAAVFRAENDVNNNKAKRLWHAEDYGPTAQASTHTQTMSANGAIHSFASLVTVVNGALAVRWTGLSALAMLP